MSDTLNETVVNAPPARPMSPCISICALDLTGHCAGCLRSRDEIAGWIRMTPEQQWQLLRVLVAPDLGVYPEISGSHYRSSVRFVVWNGFMERPRQSDTDIPFDVVCCT
ncbi:MAG: cell division protein ZapD [Gammaproteobacteria bacterium]|nr:cell division protein ZapD [Gammaproteobacteria bacterium]